MFYEIKIGWDFWTYYSLHVNFILKMGQDTYAGRDDSPKLLTAVGKISHFISELS
jgi:hypothetical protein